MSRRLGGRSLAAARVVSMSVLAVALLGGMATTARGALVDAEVRSYDKELVRMMLIGGITTEQPGEMGLPVSTVSAATGVVGLHAKVGGEPPAIRARRLRLAQQTRPADKANRTRRVR